MTEYAADYLKKMVPKAKELEDVIYKTIFDLGGVASNEDILKGVEDRLTDVPEEVKRFPYFGSTKRTELQYNVEWAKTNMKKAGLITNPRRGLWSTCDTVWMDCVNEPYETWIYVEGKKVAHYTTKYERDPICRAEAIRIHGTKCMICGFDFEKTYGEHGAGLIEIHHVNPLYENEKETSVDPSKDLVCLCSNCHRMIHHKRNKIYSVEEIRSMVDLNKQLP